jgi:hypothetical protein
MVQTQLEPAAANGFAPGPREARPRPALDRRPPAARLALVHGVYLVATGGWELVPRRRAWTGGLGACLVNVGAALAAAGLRGKVSRELRLLGVGVGLSFAAIQIQDLAARRRLSPLHLVNGAVQLAFAALWGAAALREIREARRPPEAAFA